jgi:hypothetical protein
LFGLTHEDMRALAAHWAQVNAPQPIPDAGKLAPEEVR